MALLDVEHRLRFEYDDFIHESWMELRVQPRSSVHQTVHSFYLAVGPPASVARYTDWNDNLVHHFGIADYHDRIEVVARSLVDVHPTASPLTKLAEEPSPASGALLDFVAFGGPVILSPRLEALDREAPVAGGVPLGEQVERLGVWLRERFEYTPGVTDYRSSTEHVLDHGKGVCQDFAHLLLGLLRLRGIPCRYVSGYLHVESSAREPAQSHAWVEVYSQRHGWLPYDPTHARIPDDRYVCVGRGRHYDDTAPNRGLYRGKASETLVAGVRTERSEQRDVVGLHEQLEEIDVPVFREFPSRRREEKGRTPDQEDAAGQQQQ